MKDGCTGKCDEWIQASKKSSQQLQPMEKSCTLQAAGALQRKPWSILHSSNHFWSYVHMTAHTWEILISCNSQWWSETRFGNRGWLVPEHPSRVCDRRGGVNPSARGSLQPARGASSCPSQRVKRAVLKGASSAWCLSIDNIYLVKMERETTYRALYKVCFVQETLLMNKPFPIILSLLHPSSFPQTLQTCQAYSLQGLLQTVFVISFSLSRSLI